MGVTSVAGFRSTRSNLIPYPFPKACCSFHNAKLDRAPSSIKRIFLVTLKVLQVDLNPAS